MYPTGPKAHSHSRRDFLRLTAAFGAAAMLPRFAYPENPFALLQSHRAMKQHDPFNFEPDLARLVHSWVTPHEQFYVRSHAKTPVIDPGEYHLRVTGLVERELTLSLAELSGRYAQANTVATLQCAGNRREEFSRMKKVGGVQWGPGAIGNADWSGVRLGDILKAAGVKDGARHVQFKARDIFEHDGKSTPYGASIPIEKALAPETLLAYAMNGAALTPAHGFPLRVVVPGFFGVRSVKWLDSITVSGEESSNYFQQEAYKILPPDVNEKNVDWSKAPALNEFVVNSAIAGLDVDQASDKPIARVTGYAVATGKPGDSLDKVELTLDGGKTWSPAAFTSPEMPYCWRLWHANVLLEAGAASIAVRATAKSGATQAAQIDWNFKGYCYNAWHGRNFTS